MPWQQDPRCCFVKTRKAFLIQCHRLLNVSFSSKTNSLHVWCYDWIGKNHRKCWGGNLPSRWLERDSHCWHVVLTRKHRTTLKYFQGNNLSRLKTMVCHQQGHCIIEAVILTNQENCLQIQRCLVASIQWLIISLNGVQSNLSNAKIAWKHSVKMIQMIG